MENMEEWGVGGGGVQRPVWGGLGGVGHGAGLALHAAQSRPRMARPAAMDTCVARWVGGEARGGPGWLESGVWVG
jgi:hypothetical protein